MKHTKVLLLLTLLLYVSIGGTLLTAKTVEYSAKSLVFNNKKIKLNTPLIKKNSQLFFPVRDLASSLGGEFTYNRRKDIYTLSGTKLNSTIVANSPEIWINKTHHFLTLRPFFYENRLYVPLKEFFSLAGYTITPKHRQVTIASPSGQSSYAKKSSVIAQLSGPSQVKEGQFRLPHFEYDQEIYLSLGEGFYPLKRNFMYVNDVFYINLTPILKKQQYQIQTTKDTFVLSKNNVTTTFYYTKGDVTIQTQSKSTTKHTSLPLIRKDNKTFFPFYAFLSAMQLTPIWDAPDQTITLLRKINQVQLVQQNGVFKLKLLSNHPIFSENAQKLKRGNGYYIDIPYSLSFAGKNVQKLAKDVPFTFHLTQPSRSKTRLTLKKAKFDIAYPVVSPTISGAEVTFLPVIHKITESQYLDKWIVKIHSNGPFRYKDASTKTKTIIDIPNTISQLPLEKSSKGGVLHGYRSSQFSLEPPTTRIVIDRQPTTKLLSKRVENNTLVLTFPGKRKTVISKPPAPKATTLKGLSILIDPGHGGNDPGGIGKRGEYEKTYTLDISKRLQKKLQRQGAIVIMARNKDRNPSLSSRTNLANTNKVDMLVSIHINSFYSSRANGTETYYYKAKDKKLAQYIHKEMVKTLNLRNNGVKRARMYVLRHARMPAALIEPMFITNPKEVALLKKADTRERLATAIYRGIVNYHNATNRK